MYSYLTQEIKAFYFHIPYLDLPQQTKESLPYSSDRIDVDEMLKKNEI